MPLTDCDHLLLTDGRLVPAVAWAWLKLAAERGLRVTAEGGAILVHPRGRLTDDDRALVARHRGALLDLLHLDASVPLPSSWRDVHVLAGTVEDIVAALDTAVLHARMPRPGRCTSCDVPLTHPRAGEECKACRRQRGCGVH